MQYYWWYLRYFLFYQSQWQRSVSKSDRVTTDNVMEKEQPRAAVCLSTNLTLR